MNKLPLIKALQPMQDFILILTFSNGEVRSLDIKPIMEEYPLFHTLEENNLFYNAKIDLGGFGIVWNEEFSISSGDAYERSTPLEETQKSILSSIFIKSIVAVRKEQGRTQAEVSRLSGLPQPAIAKIEKNASDPRLSTLLALVDSLGYKLQLAPKEHSSKKS